MQALAPLPVQRGSGVNWPLVQKGMPHAVFIGWKPSFGQVAALPGQLSATSQLPALERHTVVLGDRTSAGRSPTCHCRPRQGRTPALGRHTVLPPASTLAGHDVEVPVQLSAGSQAPLARQTVVAGSSESAGHVAAPAQRSSLAVARSDRSAAHERRRLQVALARRRTGLTRSVARRVAAHAVGAEVRAALGA